MHACPGPLYGSVHRRGAGVIRSALPLLLLLTLACSGGSEEPAPVALQAPPVDSVANEAMAARLAAIAADVDSRMLFYRNDKQVDAMDREGLDLAVLFPSRGLFVLGIALMAIGAGIAVAPSLAALFPDTLRSARVMLRVTVRWG